MSGGTSMTTSWSSSPTLTARLCPWLRAERMGESKWSGSGGAMSKMMCVAGTNFDSGMAPFLYRGLGTGGRPYVHVGSLYDHKIWKNPGEINSDGMSYRRWYTIISSIHLVRPEPSGIQRLAWSFEMEALASTSKQEGSKFDVLLGTSPPEGTTIFDRFHCWAAC